MKKQQNQNELLLFPQIPFLSSFPCKILKIFLDLDENSTIFSLFSLQISQQNCSLIVEFFGNTPIKYYFADIPIETITKFDTFLFAGSSNGDILLWDLRITDHFYQENPHFPINLTEKFPKEILLRKAAFSTDQELFQNPLGFSRNSAAFSHKTAIKKILINKETSVKEVFSLDFSNQLIIWKLIELNNVEFQRNFLNFGLKSKVKLQNIGQINLSDSFNEPFVLQKRVLNIVDFEIDLKENMMFFSSNSKVVRCDKYGGVAVGSVSAYGTQEACPRAMFITNVELFYVGMSDGGIG